MKRTAAIVIMILALAAMVACSSTIKTRRTSLVTVTIAGDHLATLDVRDATLWARTKLLLDRLFSASQAVAGIPTTVQSIQVTVTAADMDTIISATNVVGQPEASIVVEVPNGLLRHFVVLGLDAGSVALYQGSVDADLDGTPVTLAVSMSLVQDTIAPVFAGLASAANLSYNSMLLSWTSAADNVTTAANMIYLIYQALSPAGETFTSPTYVTPAGATSYTVSNLVPGTPYYFVVRARDEAGNTDTNTVEKTAAYPSLYVNVATGADANTGTAASPFKTITKALQMTAGDEAILVSAGTYSPGGAGAGEIYPLQLKTNSALICQGSSYSTIISIDSTTVGIRGAAGGTIEGCKLVEFSGSSNYSFITDAGSAITIKNCVIQGANTFSTNGISLSGNSALLDSTISGIIFNASPGDAVSITSGSALVSGNTISGNFNGFVVSGGTATITNNVITDNSGNGITMPIGAGTPAVAITGNTFTRNSTGMNMQNGASSSSNNTINNNTLYGVSISGSTTTATLHNNSLYCNTQADLFSTATTTVDATSNAWDHDPTTTPTGPTTMIPTCGAGIDLCFSGTLVTYNPFNTAAPSPPACR